MFKGRGLIFSDVRQYYPGDDVRTIDWNITARMNLPHVKQFIEERDRTVNLVVDMSASGCVRDSRGASKREVAAELAAMVAFSAIKNNDRVGLYIVTDQVERTSRPRRAASHVLRVVGEILAFEPQSRGTDLAAGLEYLGKVARRRSVVFLVSDFLSSGWERPMRITAQRHDLVPVVVTDPMEANLPPVGLILLEDVETGEVVEFDTSGPARRAFARRSRPRPPRRDTALRRLNVDVVDGAHRSSPTSTRWSRSSAPARRGWRTGDDDEGDEARQLAGRGRARRGRGDGRGPASGFGGRRRGLGRLGDRGVGERGVGGRGVGERGVGGRGLGERGVGERGLGGRRWLRRPGLRLGDDHPDPDGRPGARGHGRREPDRGPARRPVHARTSPRSTSRTSPSTCREPVELGGAFEVRQEGLDRHRALRWPPCPRVADRGVCVGARRPPGAAGRGHVHRFGGTPGRCDQRGADPGHRRARRRGRSAS